MQNDKIYKKGEIKIIRSTLAKYKTCTLGEYGLKRTLYWFGIGLEL